ncbi:MAG: hypothetical protein Q8P41_29005 [Pseudomonadota bacterium]|nr:hypothetical protein [Pseudomonadota bacterium]
MPTPLPAGRAGQRPLVGLGAPLLAALSLGLAPFLPEPHLVGKLRWVAGGAHGMVAMDWMDLAFHGAPWVWLFGALAAWAWRRAR